MTTFGDQSHAVSAQSIGGGGGHGGINLALNVQEEGKRSYVVLERETIFTKWKKDKEKSATAPQLEIGVGQGGASVSVTGRF